MQCPDWLGSRLAFYFGFFKLLTCLLIPCRLCFLLWPQFLTLKSEVLACYYQLGKNYSGQPSNRISISGKTRFKTIPIQWIERERKTKRLRQGHNFDRVCHKTTKIELEIIENRNCKNTFIWLNQRFYPWTFCSS